jgi:hypothetical protein
MGTNRGEKYLGPFHLLECLSSTVTVHDGTLSETSLRGSDTACIVIRFWY